jgi:calcineurin-like phosphoesterase family protein
MKKVHIQLEKDQKVWFTSDLHFGHRNVIRFCNRPFANEKEMGEKLIENWNSVVGDNDIVFVLGDTFWFNDSKSIKKTLDQLKGKTIYMIPGNHDEFEHYYRVLDSRIVLCPDIVTLWLQEYGSSKKKEIYMQHCPMSTWPHRVNGVWHLFGHIHSNAFRTEGVDQDLPLHWNQHDVGCDYWGYRPVDFETLQRLFDARETRSTIK